MYACTEEILELLWKANSRRFQRGDGEDEGEDEADASYARSPVGRGIDLQEVADSNTKQTTRSKLKIPQVKLLSLKSHAM